MLNNNTRQWKRSICLTWWKDFFLKVICCRNQKEILENNQRSKKYARNHCFLQNNRRKSLEKQCSSEMIKEWLKIRKNCKEIKNYIKRITIHWYLKKLNDDAEDKLESNKKEKNNKTVGNDFCYFSLWCFN